MPHACIGVDVIVGFPGETDEHFLETYRYLNEMDISYLFSSILNVTILKQQKC
jgi:threonylcarbamoyladenosine tRNA methylthiotransferase MtaB